ncbi:NUDIX hydrolase [Agreia sp.]|uniref:NUDIX hydrolase n=1 Tax=Agreia sp. TaxID=1872416 RepID=UPI0035BC4571
MTATSEAERPWRFIGSKRAYTGRVTIATHSVELPGGQEIEFEVDESIPFAVAVLVIEGDSIVLARQYRYPLDRWIYDLPGGAGEQGEEPMAAAARECREELGLDPTDLRPLHIFFPNPGRSAWPVHLYSAHSTVEAEPESADPAEQVATVRLPLGQLDAMIANGDIVDPSLLIARLAASVHGLLPAVGATALSARPAAQGRIVPPT